MPTDDSKTSTTEATPRRVAGQSAYENARQRDAVIAVMHRLKRVSASSSITARSVPEFARYYDGCATTADNAIEELRKALCLPKSWAGEGDPS